MGLFDKLFKKEEKEKTKEIPYDTRNFFLGAPEAEAESTAVSRMKLPEVFDDYLQALPELQHEKFIISGRKGSGKTAIGEFIYNLAYNDPNYFCEFIRKSDIDIENITQIAQHNKLNVTQELLIEWIILTKLVKLLTTDESLSGKKEINDLRIFLDKNSGFIDIKSNQITEVISNGGYEVNVNYFQRWITSKFGKSFTIKGEKAPFYKLIPALKRTVEELISKYNNPENNYILIFDDLDINFKSDNLNSISTLLNLLRIVKDYNINFFGKNNYGAKIIILLRDDISRVLIDHDADTAKIFSSYEISLQWYEHDVFKRNEDLTKIKQFINRRIAYNFEQNQLKYDKNDPWGSLIDKDIQFKNSSFNLSISVLSALNWQ